ncbi:MULTISPECIES: hypothetical protein [Metabacillus]|uniref:hypothetical protein n=1 Tax=Metabacillus TaxID=2675233 RepID=UPI001B9076E9|nr:MULTISPECIES: hypothetical protein [Metabacillus]MCM3164508.1 hypothetical protein [Metabacillus litoralis]UGB33671.1 hypothetical protein LPC09_25795 [Metabacillus sp. B2-18]
MNSEINKIEDRKRKLSTLSNGIWYYITAGSNHSNLITGIKLDDESIFIKYIGGDFEGTPFTFSFKLSKAAMDEMWKYEFNTLYNGSIDLKVIDLDWVSDIATIPYTLLNDLSISPKYTNHIEG